MSSEGLKPTCFLGGKAGAASPVDPSGNFKGNEIYWPHTWEEGFEAGFSVSKQRFVLLVETELREQSVPPALAGILLCLRASRPCQQCSRAGLTLEKKGQTRGKGTGGAPCAACSHLGGHLNTSKVTWII